MIQKACLESDSRSMMEMQPAIICRSIYLEGRGDVKKYIKNFLENDEDLA
ncbi:hypothetical protein [Thermoanaerobacterium sp. DL9XJH110]